MTNESEPPKENEELVFSLDLEEIPFKVRPKGSKDLIPYKLVELDGGDRDDYVTLVNKRSTRNSAGAVVDVELKDLQGELLSRSVRRYSKESETWNKVTIPEIRSWPGKMQSALFEEAQKLSGLDELASKKEEGK